MTKVVQTTISINEDDLRLTTSTPKYPLGIIYEVRKSPSESNINSRYIIFLIFNLCINIEKERLSI